MDYYVKMGTWKASADREIFAIGIDYEGSSHQELPTTVDDTRRVISLFASLGFSEREYPASLACAGAVEIAREIHDWSAAMRSRPRMEAAVLFVGGHGRIHNGRHFVLTHDSPEMSPYSSFSALSALDMVESIINGGASRCLVILDSCRSGYAATEMEHAISRYANSIADLPPKIALLASCLHYEDSYSGAFVEALSDAVLNGSRSQRHWRDLDPFITPGELCDELCERLGGTQLATVAGRDSVRIIPNPRFRAPSPDRPAEVSVLLESLSPDDREHFLMKASGADAVDVGWYFSGRARITSELLAWAKSESNGILILTGAPGSGKSAILGRLGVLADVPAQLACLKLGLRTGNPATLPDVGMFDAVIHLKNKTANAAAAELMRKLGAEEPALSGAVARAVEFAKGRKVRQVFIFDALDEASPGDITVLARDFLRELARLDGVLVIVGTRRSVHGRGDGQRLLSGPIISSLSFADVPPKVLDVSQDSEADDSIREYATKRLARTWIDNDAIALAARAVSALSQKVFLVARFAVRVLETQTSDIVYGDDWEQVLEKYVGPAGLWGAIDDDLSRLTDPVRVREVLRALAFARGKGLPRRRIWAELASELSQVNRKYSDDDVTSVINDAAWYLIESVEDGQAVFRLYHQSIGDLFAREILA